LHEILVVHLAREIGAKCWIKMAKFEIPTQITNELGLYRELSEAYFSILCESVLEFCCPLEIPH
jgi:hypothetical protein